MPRAKTPKKNGVKDPLVKDPTTTTTSSATVLQKLQNVSAATEPATAPTAIVAPEPRRLEIVKPESRASVVPINLEDEIRALAYEFSARRGFIPGYETEDWLAAEREIRQRYHQRSA
jgi:Protein of unknown function (DUF2934)